MGYIIVYIYICTAMQKTFWRPRQGVVKGRFATLCLCNARTTRKEERQY